jgi:hypothetical protein
MNNKLPCLQSGGRKHSPKNCHIQSTFHGRICLVHIRHRGDTSLFRTIQAASSPCTILGSVGMCKFPGIHRNHALQRMLKDILPLPLGEMLAVVFARFLLRRVLLLEERASVCTLFAHAGQVVERYRGPVLADDLRYCTSVGFWFFCGIRRSEPGVMHTYPLFQVGYVLGTELERHCGGDAGGGGGVLRRRGGCREFLRLGARRVLDCAEQENV